MRNLIAIIEALGVPISEVTFWDETVGVIAADDLVAGDNVLAEHVTQRGDTGLLCYWMQHYYPDPAETCPCRGELYPLGSVGETAQYWRLSMAGQPLPNLSFVREIRNPWYSDAGCCPPCFYLTPVGRANTRTVLTFNTAAAQAGYSVAGRLIGFDFPQRYMDKERSLGERP